MKISCLILTYNEAARIRTALTHAFKWADEVAIIDKGSTDGTQEIARNLGARCYPIPFSRQGHENLEVFASYAEHDWVWAFTPGEVPTKKLIETGKAMIGDHVDLIIVPHKYYSFGVHNPDSPWSVSGQPRLYNRKRVKFGGRAHGAAIDSPNRQILPYSEDCYVLHQTHGDMKDFMRSHADYMIGDAGNGTPEEVMARAHYHLTKYAPSFAKHEELFPQSLGWQIYWMGVFLHGWERKNPGILEQYKARADELLKTWQ